MRTEVFIVGISDDSIAVKDAQTSITRTVELKNVVKYKDILNSRMLNQIKTILMIKAVRKWDGSIDSFITEIQ